MKIIGALLFIFSSSSFACDVLFLDFNNSKKEISACRDGVQTKDPNGDVVVVGMGDKVNGMSIEATLSDIKKRGGCIDSIAISGHQIGGQFAGENGAISASSLSTILNRYKAVAGDHLETATLLGCYSTVLVRCENDYLKSLSPNIKTAVGFTLQSPSNERRADWDATRFICQNRKEAADAQNAARLNDYLKNLTNFVNQRDPSTLAIGLCIGGTDGKGAVCSRDYHLEGEKNGCYHTWDELKRACGDEKAFGPTAKLGKTYEKFFAAETNEYAEPPGDNQSVDVDDGDGNLVKLKSPIRQIYAKANLWEHCAEAYKRDFSFTMPKIGQMIRLDKFRELKANIQANNGRQLRQYNAKLVEAGLGQYKLDDLTLPSMNRKAIKDRLNAVLSKVGSGHFESTDEVDGDQLYKMATQISRTLIGLTSDCSNGNMLHEKVGSAPSGCIRDYGKYK